MGMNREMRRASDREGKRRQALHWNQFSELSFEDKQKMKYFGRDLSKFDKVVSNNRYIVFITEKQREFEGRWWDRVMVRRSDSLPICDWQDLFRIKNELFGDETEAIQFLPRKSELVDSANLYWFFVRSK